jgi:hypothetical protein
MRAIILIFKTINFHKAMLCLNKSFLMLLLIGLTIKVGAQADTSTVALKAKKKKIFSPEYSASIGLKNQYNDNLLEYSNYFIKSFVSGEDSGRFHINTYDALLVKPSVLFTVRLPLLKQKPTELWVYATHVFTIKDNKKGDFSNYTFGLDQKISPSIRAGFSYSYIPFFYLFHFRDEDYTNLIGFTPRTFMPLTYTKNKYKVDLSYKWKKIKLNFMGLYSQYFFNTHFTEYDAIEPGFGLDISSVFFKQKFTTKLFYEYSRSMAKGYDEEGETKLNADESDPSNYKNRYGVQLDYSIPKIRKVSTSLNIEMGVTTRDFLSEHFIERDMFHTGRRDIVANLDVAYKIPISKHITFTLTYEHNRRKAGSRSPINDELIDRERSYIQNVYGLAINYKLNSKTKKKNTKAKPAKSKNKNPTTRNNNNSK